MPKNFKISHVAFKWIRNFRALFKEISEKYILTLLLNNMLMKTVIKISGKKYYI
jgi:hypothetical protein